MLLIVMAFAHHAGAQAPVNDDCGNASVITIPNNGRDTGTLHSLKVNLKNATVQQGESFTNLQLYAGTDKKTVWYKFTMLHHRQVTVHLMQRDSAIAQNGVSFAVYKTSGCLPDLGQLSSELPAISKFGFSKNTCLSEGDYLVQVCARADANDSIWIDLHVEESYQASFENPKTPANAGIISSAGSLSVHMGCNTNRDDADICPAFGKYAKDFNQTAWFTFQTPSVSDAFVFGMSLTNTFGYLDSQTFAYNLYEGNCSTGSIKLISGCNIVRAAYKYAGPQFQIGNYCHVKTGTWYSIQVFAYKNATYNLNFSATNTPKNIGKAADPSNLPATFLLGRLQAKKSYSVIDNMGCNSKMVLYPCGTAMQTKDTQAVNTWYTFSLGSAGQLLFSKLLGGQVRLYNGDITQNCNLSYQVILSSTLCLQAGSYSIQIVGTMGTGTASEFSFNPQAIDSVSKFYRPKRAEQMNDITARLGKGPIAGTADYFSDSFPAIDTIDGLIFRDFPHYRQFYISKPAFLKITESDPTNGNSLNSISFFSGKATDGLKALKRVATGVHGYGIFSSVNIFTSGCTPLPPGWYTVRSSYHSDYCMFTAAHADNISIDTVTFCTPHFNRPYRANYVNQTMPITWGPDHGNNGYEDDGQSYYFTGECFSCQSDSPLAHYVVPCAPATTADGPYNRVAYYVFDIDKPSYARFNDGVPADYAWVMCRGDVRKDSSLGSNSKNIIEPCDGTGIFCNLQPGRYSLIAYVRNSLFLAPSLFLDRVLASKYDHAANAYDFGLVPLNSGEKQSPDDIISCGTGAYIGDPDLPAPKLSADYYYGANKSSVPYPLKDVVMLPPFAQQNSTIRNLWYTFVAGGVGDITIKLYSNGQNVSTGINNIHPVLLMSNEDPKASFATLKSSGKVDSTMKQGLVSQSLVHVYGQNQPDDSYVFHKTDCDTHRYYILADNSLFPVQGATSTFVLNQYVRVGVASNGISFSRKGDYCTDAISSALNGPGATYQTATVYCMSAGESYGEDGSNMACLTDGGTYKTVWFKTSYNSDKQADLTFSISNNTSALSSKVRYRVLYGSCDAMTPGPCVGGAGASFQLDCMGRGDYYIQVAMPADAAGEISAQMTATPGKQIACSPLKPFTPLANFIARGGCNGEDISFKNYSTAGAAVKYLWDFGNGKTSAARTPVMQYKAVNAVDSYHVSLKVFDTLHHTSDSVSRWVYVFRDTVKIRHSNDTSVQCGTILKLYADAGFKGALYQWSGNSQLSDIYSATPTYTATSNQTLYITADVQNCEVTDSVHINGTAKINISGDNIICPGDSTLLTADSGFTSYYWMTNNKYLSFKKSIWVKTPGVYNVTGYIFLNNYSCAPAAYVNVRSSQNMPLIYGRDTTLCIGNKLKLYALQPGRHLWSTGDTTDTITVYKTGTYSLMQLLSRCTLKDSVSIMFADLSGGFMGNRDTTICRNETALLGSGVPFARYKWSTGDTTEKIKVNKAGIYTVTVTLPGCTGTDSKMVRVMAPPNTSIGKPDTAFCEGDSGIIMVNPISSGTYLWSTGDTLNYTRVKRSGIYTVKVHQYLCDTLLSKTVDVQPLPRPNLGHDTIACYNFERLLDAGPGASYLWWPGGQTSRYLDTYKGGTFAVVVKTDAGCMGTDTVVIITHCDDPTFYVPDVFTPDKNGINDSFKVQGTGITQYDMRIFNRWGEMVFESKDMNLSWDGRYKEKPVPQDVYLWIVHYSGNGQAKMASGTVTLLR